jgi:hypothetical protein
MGFDVIAYSKLSILLCLDSLDILTLVGPKWTVARQVSIEQNDVKPHLGIIHFASAPIEISREMSSSIAEKSFRWQSFKDFDDNEDDGGG